MAQREGIRELTEEELAVVTGGAVRGRPSFFSGSMSSNRGIDLMEAIYSLFGGKPTARLNSMVRPF